MGCCHEHEFVDQLFMQTTITDSQADYNVDIYRGHILRSRTYM